MKLASCIFVLFVICACTPDKNEEVYDNCILKEIVTNGDTSLSKGTFAYDASGRLTSISNHNSYLLVAYADHQITTTESPDLVRKYFIGNDSLAKYRVSTWTGAVDSTVYEYDSDRYLRKQVRYQNGSFADSVTYIYVNGNRVKWTRYNKTGVSDYSDLKYDENLVLKSWYLQNFQSWPDLYFPFLGKPNKNLIIEQRIPAWNTWASFSYKFNASGYVTQFIDRNEGAGGASATHNLIYDCQ